MWARKGTRPRALKQQQFTYAYLYGAVCPSTGQAIGLVLPNANTACMNLHIDEISRSIAEDRHALILMDGAGWHQASLNRDNVTIMKIPPYSPELNPCEQVWQYIKDKWLKNRCYANYDDILGVGLQRHGQTSRQNKGEYKVFAPETGLKSEDFLGMVLYQSH